MKYHFKLCLLVVLLCCVSCAEKRVCGYEKQPRPERPILQEITEDKYTCSKGNLVKLIHNNDVLMLYANQLEACVEGYEIQANSTEGE